jgi:putative protease
VIIKGKHLLSLRDMNRMDSLEELMDAGVCSFKIEGRLKDVPYVKNVSAAYSQAIDKVLVRRNEYVRASSGHSVAHFTPNVSRSFNRGFTSYFLHGRTDDIYSFGTPKSIGEKMGPVKEVGPGWLKVSGFKAFHNGDGLCFFNRQGELEGYRVNRVEGNRVFLFLESTDMPSITAGTELYRNYDIEFEKVLSKESATRKIGVDILFREIPSGYEVVMTDEDGYKARAVTEWKKEDARTPQEDNIRTQLSKLGGTRFEAVDVEIQLEGERFIPSSLLSDMRRSVAEKLESLRLESYTRPLPGTPATPHYPVKELSYLGNVMNAQARTFYQDHGVTKVDDAFEKSQPDSATVMFCRHCIKYALGICTKNRKRDLKIQEPLFLNSQDGRRFRLKFDCSRCQMEIMYQ